MTDKSKNKIQMQIQEFEFGFGKASILYTRILHDKSFYVLVPCVVKLMPNLSQKQRA